MKLDYIEARTLKNVLENDNYLHTKQADDAHAHYLELYQQRVIRQILETALADYEASPKMGQQ
jgi:hypothetical protein